MTKPGIQSQKKSHFPPSSPEKLQPKSNQRSLIVRFLSSTLFIVIATWLISAGAFLVLFLSGPEHLELVDQNTSAFELLAWIYFSVLTLQALTLFLSKTKPTLCFIIIEVLEIFAIALMSQTLLASGSVALAVSVYKLYISKPTRASLIQVASVGLLNSFVFGILHLKQIDPLQTTLMYLVQSLFIMGVPILIAQYVVTNRRLVKALEQETALLQQEKEMRIQAALEQDRTTMARELHDVAAHDLSGIVVMSTAVSRLVETKPKEAQIYIEQIRDQANVTLDNLRKLVGLLRSGSADERNPTADLSDIPTLVEQVRRRGVTVDLQVLKDETNFSTAGRTAPGPLAQLAGYRMVQESLANATIHSPGASCEVTVDYTNPQVVRLQVTNGPAVVGPMPSRRSGLGLIGMQERAELSGSHLEFGATEDGGWQVSLTIPKGQKETLHD